MKVTIEGSEASTAPLQRDSWQLRIDDGGYRVRWGTGYRLECLSNGRDLVFPSLIHSQLELKPEFPRPLILIGEEGAGETSLLHWLKSRHQAPQVPLAQEHDLANFGGGDLNALIAYLTDGGNDLLGFLKKQLGATVIVFMRLDYLDPVVAGSLLGRLRHAFESASHDTSLRGLALVLMGRDEQAFDTEPYSAIANVCELCRLPRFTHAEVSALLSRHWRGEAGRFDPQALAVQRITGGQPLLTQSLLKHLDPAQPEQFDAVRVYRHLRDNPPDALGSWRQRLARMILRDDRIAASVTDLLGGREYPIGPAAPHLQAPYHLRSLSLSGWLSPGLSADGQTPVWRFSDLHRSWAGPVRREPEAFLGKPRATGIAVEAGR